MPLLTVNDTNQLWNTLNTTMAQWRAIKNELPPQIVTFMEGTLNAVHVLLKDRQTLMRLADDIITAIQRMTTENKKLHIKTNDLKLFNLFIDEYNIFVGKKVDKIDVKEEEGPPVPKPVPFWSEMFKSALSKNPLPRREIAMKLGITLHSLSQLEMGDAAPPQTEKENTIFEEVLGLPLGTLYKIINKEPTINGESNDA